MTTVTEDGGRTNMYAKEPQMYTMEVSVTHNEKAEKLNGRLAMLGVILAKLKSLRCCLPLSSKTLWSATTLSLAWKVAKLFNEVFSNYSIYR